MGNRKWEIGNRALVLTFDLLPFGEALRARRAGRVASSARVAQ
ncbi:hypothetical protein QUA42_09245 [Microcoleus sp. Pol11C2]